MSDRTLLKKARTLKELEVQKKALEKEIAVLQESIKAEMKNREADKLEIGDCVVKWTGFTKNSFDSKGFKVDHPRLYQKYLNQTQGKRFSVA